jgi:hypothetical protein
MNSDGVRSLRPFPRSRQQRRSRLNHVRRPVSPSHPEAERPAFVCRNDKPKTVGSVNPVVSARAEFSRHQFNDADDRVPDLPRSVNVLLLVRA